jgi:MFS family permease
MRRLPARFVFFASEFWLSAAHTVSFTVTAVYFVQVIDMSPLELVLVGTAMEVAVFVFEIPTGVVADTYGRKRSLLIGWMVMGLAMVGVAASETFLPVLLAYALWGFGYTFTSGAEQAWITDEVGVASVGRVFARGQQLGYAGGLVGIGASVALASWSLPGAIAFGGLLSAAFVGFAAVFMPETGFRRPAHSTGRRGPHVLASGARRSVVFVRARPLLLLILATTFFAGASTESFDRLWQAHILLDIGLPSLGSLDPVVWFGIFGAVTMLLGLVGSEYLVRRFTRVGQQRLARLLLAVTAAQMGTIVVFALSGSFAVAVAGMWAYYLTRSLAGPVYDTWVNEQITDSSVRATVISISGQSDAVGQVVGGPGLGAVGSVWSIRAALLAGAAVLAPALGLYARAAQHGGRDPELTELRGDA